MTIADVRRRITIEAEGRYDRQTLAGWSQRRLAGARVLVVGAGAIGNEVVKGLALVGVGTTVIVDMDHVAPSNLTRCVLFRDGDVGRAKSEVVAQRAAELNPDCTFIPVVGDLEWALSDEDFWAADVILGCLDNAYARYVINRRARQARVHWIDGGISDAAVQVTHLAPDGPCWACGIGDRTLENLRARFSCTGFRRVEPTSAIPTTAVTATVAGALMLHAAVSLLHGKRDLLGSRQTQYMSPPRLMSDGLSLRPDCPYHRKVPGRPRATLRWWDGVTLADLASQISTPGKVTLWLDKEVVQALWCGTCGARTNHQGVLAKMPQELAVCGDCGSTMMPETVGRVSGDSPSASRPLAEFGVNRGDWIEMTTGGRRRRFVLGEGYVGTHRRYNGEN